MKTWIRRGLWAVLALAVLAAGVLFAGAQLAERKMNRRIELPPVALALPSDAAALARGEYLFRSRGCADCHGRDGAGRTFVDNGALKLAGPNISPGPGSVVAAYRPEDWERTLRHGVKPDGRPLMVMPSEDYAQLTDADTAALAAYVKSLPPVAGGPAVVALPLPVRALYGFGRMQDAAAKIDHSRPRAQPVAEGVTVEHGRYVASMCIGCHGKDLAGGRIPGAPPDWPAAARLAPGDGSAMARYPDAAAMQAMFRSGLAPSGTPLKVMPFESLRELSDVDVQALFLYLKTAASAAS